MSLRPVQIYKWFRDSNFTEHYEKVIDVLGNFHGFGTDYKELEKVFVSFAIVEVENGEVRKIPVDMIQFLDVELSE